MSPREKWFCSTEQICRLPVQGKRRSSASRQRSETQFVTPRAYASGRFHWFPTVGKRAYEDMSRRLKKSTRCPAIQWPATATRILIWQESKHEPNRTKF